MPYDPVGTVARWLASPERSVTATMGAHMLEGEWLGAREVEELGASPSMLHQTRATLEAAGYKIEREKLPVGNGYRYRVKGSPEAGRAKGRAPRGSLAPMGSTFPPAEASAPPLGAVLTVRALILGTDGRTEVALTDGNGGTWTAHLTGP